MVAVNVVVLAGRVVDGPDIRTEGDDTALVFRLHVAEPSIGNKLPLLVRVIDEQAKRQCNFAAGVDVLVRGSLVRRFRRNGGGGRSVTEVIATEIKVIE
jgi:single-stranded DNA-binding protein